MTDATKFQCPKWCGAEYKIVRVEAPLTCGRPLFCLSCDAPLRNREGKSALEYFRTDGPGAKYL